MHNIGLTHKSCLLAQPWKTHVVLDGRLAFQNIPTRFSIANGPYKKRGRGGFNGILQYTIIVLSSVVPAYNITISVHLDGPFQSTLRPVYTRSCVAHAYINTRTQYNGSRVRIYYPCPRA